MKEVPLTNPITVLAPCKLAQGVTEAQFLAASDVFQRDFAGLEPGIIRRELVRKGEGEYLDIVQFRSMEDAHDVMEKEKQSKVCNAFFALLDESADVQGAEDVGLYPSLATYA